MKKSIFIWVILLTLSIYTTTYAQSADIKNKIVESVKTNLKSGKFFINGSKEGDNINYYFGISDLSVSSDDSKYTWTYKWEFVISQPATCTTSHGCDWWIKGEATSTMSFAQAIKQLGEDKIFNMKVFTDPSLKPLDSETCQVSNVTTNKSDVFTEPNKCQAFVPFQIGSNGEIGKEFQNLIRQLLESSAQPTSTNQNKAEETKSNEKAESDRIKRLKRKIN